MKKTTLDLLIEEFHDQGVGAVPLKDVCVKYLGISPSVAQDAATAGKLPLPCFRIGTSRKAPWLVNLADLANVIDSCQEAARKEWEEAQAMTWPLLPGHKKKGAG